MQTGDIFFVALWIAFVVFFFVFGTGRIYESMVGSILGIALYLMTDMFVDSPNIIDLDNTFNYWIVRSSDTIKYWSLTFTLVLLIICPIVSLIHIGATRSNVVGRVSKSLTYSMFYLLYTLSILAILVYGPVPFEANNFFTSMASMSWWKTHILKSELFQFSREHAFTILYLGIVAMILKFLFSKIAYKALFWIGIGIISMKEILSSLLENAPWKKRDEVMMYDPPPEEGGYDDAPEDS